MVYCKSKFIFFRYSSFFFCVKIWINSSFRKGFYLAKIIPWMCECHGWSDAPRSSERSNNTFIDTK